MYSIKLIFQLFLLFTLSACAAEGPIKAYDEKAVTDTVSLSFLYLPPEIELIEVDGKSFDTPLITAGYNEVHLLPGRHQIAVKYLKFWGDATAGSLVASKPVIFDLNVQAKAKYYLKYDQPKDELAAQSMVQKFSPWLADQHGVKVQVASGQHGTKTLTSGNNAGSASNAPTGDIPLEQLKYWWKSASFKEKKAFESWMNQN